PMGPASVLFGGEGLRRTFTLEDEGDLGLVGATSDAYRIIYAGYEAHAGRDVLLSPDGTKVALQSGIEGGPSILDLRTAQTHSMGSFPPGSGVTPQAWARGNRYLALEISQSELGQRSLVLVDEETGRQHQIASVPEGQGLIERGW